MRFKNNKMKLSIDANLVKQINSVMTGIENMMNHQKDLSIGPIPVCYDDAQFATIYVVDGKVNIEFAVS